MRASSSAASRRFAFVVLGVATVLTLGNALKPLTVDDTAYHAYATQVARAPLDPYGFVFFWYQAPQPAFDILVPPLLPYWLSIPVRLAGGDPLACKIWMFPFSLLFAGSLVILLRRWTPGLEIPLLVLTALSPAILPSFNLMLDLPALSLSLSGLALFVRADDRGSAWLASAAGCVIGLAAQTKYSALAAPAVVALYGVTRGEPDGADRRWPGRGARLALLAGVTALAVFAGWEVLMWRHYGASHFVHHLGGGALQGPLRKALWGLTSTGGVGAAWVLLALTALGVRAARVYVAGALLLLVHVAVAAVPPTTGLLAASGPRGLPGPVPIGRVLYTLVGAALTIAVCVVAARLVSRRRDPDSIFVVGWLLLEVATYFLVTPFPAVRRVLGVLVAATVVGGRLASRTCGSGPRRRLVRAVATLSVALGVAVYAVDYREADAARLAVKRAVRRIGMDASGATVWYIGHWGFQFHAERAGMQALVPGVSRLRRRDWLVVPDRVWKPSTRLSPEHLEPVAPTIEVRDPLPLHTVPGFYGDAAPLAPKRGPRLTVTLFRVLDDFVPPAGD